MKPIVHYNFKSYLHIIQLMLCTIMLSNCESKNNTKKSSNKIIVEATIKNGFYRNLKDIFAIKEEMFIRYVPLANNQLNDSSQYISGKFIDGKVKWTIPADKSFLVTPPFGASIILNPGDSIHILYQKNYPVYSGLKKAIVLLDTLMFLQQRILNPIEKYSIDLNSFDDFLEWNQYLDKRLALQLPVLDSFKNKLTFVEYQHYKADLIGNIESDRLNAFISIFRLANNGNSNISASDLIQIWDSTQLKPTRLWLESLSEYDGSIYHFFSYAKMKIHRLAGFNLNLNLFQDRESFVKDLYNYAKTNYKEVVRERLVAFILEGSAMKEMGVKNTTTQILLKDYYSQTGYPEFKQWVKKEEKKRQLEEIEKEKKVKAKA